MKTFYLDESIDGNFMVSLPSSVYDLCKGSHGSYNVFMARLFGLNYADYLKMCRDKYSAILYGKEGYTIAKWNKEGKIKASELVKELNARYKVWETKAKELKLI